MNAGQPFVSEEQFVDLLVSYDEALAAGKNSPGADTALVPADLQPRLQRILAGAKLLRALLPKPLDPPGQRERLLPGAGRLGLLGRFELRRELGRGGYGIVYLAFDPRLGREVALKIPRPETLLHQGHRQRFLREAQAAAGLDHPNLVSVYEAGESGPICYIASAYCPGPTLADWLKQQESAIPARDAAALVKTLADAVQHAHGRGILHRDLKPANVLLQSADIRSQTAHLTDVAPPAGKPAILSLPSAIPKITDFGLAKLLDADSEQTRTGEILGTPCYMAPEQADGRNTAIGPATDIYALGVILYELLTRQLPFKGETFLETLDMVRRQEPASPSQIQPHVPRDLGTICLKCLHKEPRRRYATGYELAADLQRFLEGKPIQARPAGTLERAWRWSRRNPLLALLTAAVFVLLVVVTIGSMLAALHLRDRLEEVRLAKQDTTERLWESLLEQARAIRLTHQPGQRFFSLEALNRAADLRPDPRLRNEYIACLALSDLRPDREWEGYPLGSTWTVFDENVQRYAVSNASGSVSVRRASDNHELARLDGFAPGPLPIVSPSGRFVGVAHRPDADRSDLGKLDLWEIDGGKPNLTLRVSSHVRWDTVEFSVDDKFIAYRQTDGSICVHETATGQAYRRFTVAADDGYLLFHPREPLLAVTGKQVQVLDLVTGQVRTRLPESELTGGSAWHPEGRMLAVARQNGQIALWDVTTDRLIRVLPGHPPGLVNLGFSHAGHVLASRGVDNKMRLWDPWSGALVTTGPWIYPAFSLDDREIGGFTHGTRVSLWEFQLSEVYRSLVPTAGEIICNGSIDARGRMLAVAQNNGVGLWDLVSARELAILPDKDVRGVLFDCDGALLASTAEGIYRWPHMEGSSGVLRVGPRTRLPEFGPGQQLARSANGRVLACTQDGGALVRRSDSPGRFFRLAHPKAHFVAVSPDGAWVVTATLGGTSVRIWDGQHGELVKELVLGSSSRLAFSPDGRWLATDYTGRRLWQVGTWQEHPLPAGEPLYRLTFSPDSRILAGETYFGAVQLLDPVSGREFARLEDPNGDRANWSGFVPDGSRLVTLSADSHAIHVWDLRRLRQELALRRFDWDLPPFPASQDKDLANNLQVEVVTTR